MKIKRRIISVVVLIHLLGMNIIPTNYLGQISAYASTTIAEDFEGAQYVADSDPPIKADGTGVQNGTSDWNTGDFKIRQDETEGIGKYLEVGRTAWSGTSSSEKVIVYRRGVTYFPNIHAAGSVVAFEFDCKGVGANKTKRFISLSRVKAEIGGLYINEAGKICAWEWDGSSRDFVTSDVTFEMNQWNHFKILFSTTTLQYEIYYNDMTTPIVTASFGNNPYFADSAALDVQGFYVDMRLAEDTAAENAFTDIVNVDNFEIYALDPLSVVSITPEDGSQGVSCRPAITLEHNFPIDPTSLASAVVEVNGVEASSATVSASTGDNRSCIVDLNTTLTKDTEYTVTVSGIKDIYGRSSLEAAELTFTTKDVYLETEAPKYYKDYVSVSEPGTEITEASLVTGNITGEVTFVNVSVDEEYPVSVIMGLFDKTDDSLVNIAYGEGIVEPGDGVGAAPAKVVTASFDVTGNANDYYVKTFVWKNFADMKAYSEKYMFSGTEEAANAEISNSPINAAVNHEEKLVAVSGTLSSEEKGETTLLVLRPGKTVTDITPSTVNTVVEYIGQGSTDGDGCYIFNYALDGADVVENENYNVILGGSNISPKKTTTFKYFGTGTINAVLLAIQGATSENIGNYLSDPPELIDGTINLNEILNMDLTDYRTLGNQSPVNAALAGKTFDTTDAVRTAFNNAVEIQKAIDAVQAGPIENMTAILTANNALLGLDLDNEYGYKSLVEKKLAQTSDAIDIVHTAIMQEDVLAELKEVFHKNVVIQAVNAATRDDMKQILENNNTDLELDFTGNFAKLDSDDQILVIQKLVEDYTFTEYGGNDRNVGIKPAFNYEVSKLLPKSSPGGDSSPNRNNVVSKIEITSDDKTQQVPEQKVDFVDIADVPWAQEGIRALQAMGCIEGMGDNRFAPNDVLTREQFVKILVLAFELYDEEAEVQFNDVFANAWYYRYVASAYKHGIVSGIGDGSFGVDRAVTRQEMAAMLHRAALLKKMNVSAVTAPLSFTDEADIDSYAIDSIKALQSAGIISGVGEDRFAPHEATTRAMAAKVVYGILKLKY